MSPTEFSLVMGALQELSGTVSDIRAKVAGLAEHQAGQPCPEHETKITALQAGLVAEREARTAQLQQLELERVKKYTWQHLAVAFLGSTGGGAVIVFGLRTLGMLGTAGGVSGG